MNKIKCRIGFKGRAKLYAIKQLRTVFGMGLKEAKDWCERHLLRIDGECGNRWVFAERKDYLLMTEMQFGRLMADIMTRPEEEDELFIVHGSVEIIKPDDGSILDVSER